MIDEKIVPIIKHYPIEIRDTLRCRQGWLCYCEKGIYLLQNYRCSQNHLIYESLIHGILLDRGFLYTDQMIYTEDGEIMTFSEESEAYVLRKWHIGKECDIHNRVHIKECGRMLANLHKRMKHMAIECQWMKNAIGLRADVYFEHRIRSLKNIYNYMKHKKKKTQFDQLYMEMFDKYFSCGQKALKMMLGSDYLELYQSAIENKNFCHGKYHYHHILMNQKKAVFVYNFNESHMNIQIVDIYLFLRKALEKNQWSMQIVIDFIEGYEEFLQLTPIEKSYLYILFLFPEKYWKIGNYYLNSKKNWLSKVNLGKLEKVYQQQNLRKECLGALSDWAKID